MAANQTITVLEADGVTSTDVEVLGTARQAAANSKSIALSTEDKAVLDSLATKLDTAITALQIIDNMVLSAGTANIGDVDVLTVPADPFGANADAASATTSISAKLRAIATALGTTALDLGVGTGGSRTLRMAIDTASQNANGQATMANSTPVVLASDHSVIQTAPQPLATGGLSVFRSLDMDETEEEVKATAGCLYKLRITNRTTSVRYVKLYNATAANVTVGTTTPIDTIPVPANASDYTVLTESFGGLGLTFSTALCIAATTGFADNDTGAPGTNDVIVSAYYK